MLPPCGDGIWHKLGRPHTARSTERDLVDTLFALTSFWFFSQLSTAGRTATAACRIIQGLATDAVRRALAAKPGG
jgi:hypothetical protein